MISDDDLERVALLDSGIAGELARELREARKFIAEVGIEGEPGHESLVFTDKAVERYTAYDEATK